MGTSEPDALTSRRPRFVGRSHELAVRQLADEYALTLAEWRPRLVNLSAEMGVGKTRVVQQFYETLAAGDPYWPTAMTTSNERKAVAPGKVEDGDPGFFWFGLNCYRDPAGNPAPALDSALVRQIQRHARALLARREKSAQWTAAAQKAARLIGSLIGLGPIDELIRTIVDVADAKEIGDHLRAGAAAESAVRLDVADTLETIAELINDAGRPLIFVLEDAHDADPTTLAGIERLLHGSRGALVVTTSWPAALAAQRDRDGGFGGWLAGLHTERVKTHAVPRLDDNDLAELALDQGGVRAETGGRAAHAVASRAARNPLMLLHLLAIARMNGLTLCDANVDALASMPSDAREVLNRYWNEVLGKSQPWLVAAAISGTPVHERMLAASAASLWGSDPDDISWVETVVSAGWMAAEQDPYSDNRTLRFVEAIYADVARAYADRMIPQRWEEARIASAWAAAYLAATSFKVHVAALELALRNLDESPLERTQSVRAAVYRGLGNCSWQRDRSIAATHMQQAAELAAHLDPVAAAEIAQAASLAWARAGQAGRALAVYDLFGKPAAAQRAERLKGFERYSEAVWVALDAIDHLEIGDVIFPPSVYDPEAQEPIEWLLGEAINAAVLSQDEALRKAVTRSARTSLGGACRAGLRDVAQRILRLCQNNEMIDLTRLQLDLTRLQLDLPLDDDAEPERTDDPFFWHTFGEPQVAFRLAQEALHREPDTDLSRLGLVAMHAGEYEVACSAYREVLKRAREEYAEDHPIAQRHTARLARAKAAACKDDAMAMAKRAVQIAEDEGDRLAKGNAQLTLGFALLMTGDRERAERSLRNALALDDGSVEYRLLADEAASHLCGVFAERDDWSGVIDCPGPRSQCNPWERRITCWHVIAKFRRHGFQQSCWNLDPSRYSPGLDEVPIRHAREGAEAWATDCRGS